MPCDLEDVLSRLPNHGENSSLQELSEVAHAQSTTAVLGVRWSERPPVGAPPAIVPVVGRDQRRHFVAVLKWEAERVLVQDDLVKAWVPVPALRQMGWDGTALHVSGDLKAIAAIRPHWWVASAVRWMIAAVCFGFAAVLHSIPGMSRKSHGLTLVKSSPGVEAF